MSDPFAFLNPIASSKTPAEKVLAQSTAHPIPPVTIAPINMGGPVSGMGGMGGMGGMSGMGMGMSMGMNAPPVANPFGDSMSQHGMNIHMGMGANMGMSGGMPHAPFHPQQQQQQQPVMYDNIKNLLQQKPKPPAGAFGDDASMDFLEHLGSGSAPAPSTAPPASVSSSVAPTATFGAATAATGAPTVSGGLDFGYLDSSAHSSVAPSTPAAAASTAGKSSALADRLAHGRRKTQEAARSQLGFNAGAFSSGSHVSRISLKDVGGASGSSAPRTESFGGMSVDDFASGTAASAAASGASASGFDDPFESGSTAAPRAGSGSSSSSGGGGGSSKTAPPMATVDNSFW